MAVALPNQQQQKETVKIKLLSEYAILPSKAYSTSTGYDLFSPREYTAYRGIPLQIPLDLAMEFPPDTYGCIAERSSLALRFALQVVGGVIDENYRGVKMYIFIFHAISL